MATDKKRLGREIALAVSVIVVVGLSLVLFAAGEDQPERYAAAGLEPMTADEVADQYYLLAPEILTRVYLAFNETEEDAIYDGLAEVSAGDALASLYLERVGAMAENGLDQSEDTDQEIHTMEILRLRAQRSGETFTWDTRWRVVGTVGHDTHMHVRGNIYAAMLDVAPVDGAWRITGFELTDVDRTDAGQIVPGEP